LQRTALKNKTGLQNYKRALDVLERAGERVWIRKNAMLKSPFVPPRLTNNGVEQGQDGGVKEKCH